MPQITEEIDEMIAEVQFELDPGMRPGQGEQHGGDAEAAIQHRHRYAQPAADAGVTGLDHRPAGAQLGHGALASLKKDLTLVGQAVAPRRAMKQADTEPPLQASDGFPDGRPRQMQPVRRRREAVG